MVYLEPVKLIVTYGKAKDTMFKVWTNKGEIVKKINTNAITHFSMQLTHNRKMLILGNWAPDVSIYEVELNSKNDTYKSFKDVMCLSGHKKSVKVLGISPEAKRAVSYSDDKCLKVWNINVRYKERERTQCLKTFTQDELENIIGKLFAVSSVSIIETEDSKMLYLAIGSTVGQITIIDLNTNKVTIKIDEAHNGEVL